jgi:hypothetical protein
MMTTSMHSGREVDLAFVGRHNVHLADIAKGLSHIRRFNGQTRVGYNVAAHSLHVCDIVRRAHGTPAAQLAALHHDAHEYLIGDITSPVKAWINLLCGNALHVAEAQLQRRVLDALMVRTAFVSNQRLIHLADMQALAAERRDLQPANAEPWACLDGITPDWENINDRARIPEDCWAAMYIERDGQLRALMADKLDVAMMREAQP